MVRKKRVRNHKAEWARRKALAAERGYSSPKQVTQARKAVYGRLNSRRMPTLSRSELPDFALPSPGGAMRQMRAECAQWSKAHSHTRNSQYKRSMSNAEVQAFYHAYVERVDRTAFSRRGAAKEKRLRIYQYLKEWNPDAITGGPEDWKSDLAPA